MPDSTPDPTFRPAPLRAPSFLARAVGFLRPSHRHTVFSATLLLMVSTFLSRIIGLVRVKYVAWLFGSGMAADALTAAFVLPDMISYFLVGGAASISFVSILTRYRESGREADGNRSLSIILNTMYLVLGGAILVAELAAPTWVHWWFSGFDAPKAALTVRLTRILLPAQLCFFAGGVFGSVLIVRKQFNVQALTPLIYNSGTIIGGIFLYQHFGPSALAIGTVAGAFLGPFLLNWIFAHRAGARYQLLLDFNDEGLREWVRLSLPLMIGVSLVTFDNWFISYFASRTDGAVSLMNYAKQIFTAPTSLLAQAAGAASMPFFASLWTREKYYEFATGVADSVSRVSSLGLLAASGMIALGRPLIALVFIGGKFSAADADLCSGYLTVFSLTLVFWAAQSIYARAFYAAGKTMEPAVVGTIITLLSFPIYAACYQAWNVMGLAVASNIGITLQCLTIAAMLHKRRMVSLADLDLHELGRCLFSGLVSGGLVWTLAWSLSTLAHLLHTSHEVRLLNGGILLLGSLVWMLLTGFMLMKTGSALPRVALKRLRIL